MKVKKIIPLFFSTIFLCSGLVSCNDSPFTYDGKELSNGKVGVEFEESVAINKNGFSYEIDYDSDLPLGLELSSEGLIYGIPELDGKYEFDIVAIRGRYYSIAKFSMTITSGEIVFEGKKLPDGKENEPYVTSIVEDDRIKVKLKDGSTLPEGLVLNENGVISGTPTKKVDNHEVTIIAYCQGYKDVEAIFIITIKEGKQQITDLGYIVYEGSNLELGEVGDDYYQNVATAYGVPGITYKFKAVGGIALPKGLKFTNGIILGKPIDSTYGRMKFQVIASAEGYKSVTREFTLEIQDKYVITDNFETEYIYVDNLVGAGYSGSNSGRNMIQKFTNASNGNVVGYLNTEITLTYNIIAKKATKANLTLTLGTENGTLILNQNNFLIKVNDENIVYNPITVIEDGSGSNGTKFHDYNVSKTISLKEGNNIITFSILKTADGEGTSSARGPLFDKIFLSSYEGEIGWRPKLANVK